MKIEVKNVKTFPGHESGAGFTASLYANGKKAAEVIHYDNGGEYAYNWKDDGLHAEIDKYVASLPPFPAPYSGIEIKPDLDTLVAAAVDEYELKKQCKKKLLFRLPGDTPGTARALNAPYSDKVKAWLLSRHPAAEIINERYL